MRCSLGAATAAAVDRGRRHIWLVALLALLATSCGAAGVTRVDLSVLADQQESWHGREVEVTGVVRTFDAPRHYWIEDAERHRVELVPTPGLSALVGRRVTVRGRFTFREGEGRRIEVDDLVATDDPARSAETAAVGVA